MEEPNLTSNLRAVLEVANEVTLEHKAVYIGTEHLLYGFLCVDCTAGNFLRDAGVVKSEYEA